MSVVNEMLNDLQKKQSKANLFDPFIARQETPSGFNFRSTSYVFIALLIAVIAYQFFSNNRKAEQLPIIVKAPAIAVPNLPKTTAVKEKVDAVKQDLDEDKTVELAIDKTTIEPPVVNRATSRTSFQPPVSSKSFAENKTTQTMKSVSRINQAEKKLVSLFRDWKNHSQLSNREKYKSFFVDYSELHSLKIKALKFLKVRDKMLFGEFLNLSISQYPEDPNYHYLAAKYYFSEKNYSLASGYLANIKTNDRSFNISRLAALTFQKQGKHQQAIDIYQQLMIVQPYSGEINMAIGISYEAIDNPNLAKTNFALALKDQRLNKLQRQFIRQRLVAHQG